MGKFWRRILAAITKSKVTAVVPANFGDELERLFKAAKKKITKRKIRYDREDARRRSQISRGILNPESRGVVLTKEERTTDE